MATTVDTGSVPEDSSNSEQNSSSATADIVAEIHPTTEQCHPSQNGTDDTQSENTGDNNDACRFPATSETKTDSSSPSPAGPVDAPATIASQYKDFSGIDTECFITATLRDNPKDRHLLLTLERFFQEFIHDDQQISHQFQAMNSYERMIVHRVAAFFGLNHNIDKNGHSVIVTKTDTTRIPDISFQSCIPAGDGLSNGATGNVNLPIDNATRRIPRRNDKPSHQPTATSTKPSVDTRDAATYPTANKVHRKQPRFPTNHYSQQSVMLQSSSHPLHHRVQQPMYSPVSASYYPHPQMNGSSSYVPMLPPTASQYGHGVPVPILLQQQPNGPIQYIFPAHSVQQAQSSASPNRQYMPLYRSDFVSSAIDPHHPYASSPFVHLYPSTMNNPYLHLPPTAYVQAAPSLLIPPSNTPKSVQYATNQFASLSLQSHYDSSRVQQSNHPMNFIGRSLVQSSNGSARMSAYPAHRQIRPLTTQPADKPLASTENDTKSSLTNNNNNHHSSEQIPLTDSAQRKD